MDNQRESSILGGYGQLASLRTASDRRQLGWERAAKSCDPIAVSVSEAPASAKLWKLPQERKKFNGMSLAAVEGLLA